MQTQPQPVARPTQPWLTRSVMYQIFLRIFTPEGTLAAATERLPQLSDLGVDIVYLCPICLQDNDSDRSGWSSRHHASGSDDPRNPYRIKDYFAIDPEYGTDADLRAFVTRAHQLGMRVLLDIVYFHCGPQAVFLGEHPDFVQRDAQGNIKLGEWRFPMLNFANAGLREYLYSNLDFWVREFGVDGYRCDVSGHIPVDFWEEARQRLEAIAPSTIWLAESRSPDEQRYAFDMSYSFDQNSAMYGIMEGSAPASIFRDKWRTIADTWLAGSRFIRYIDNHDLANDHYPRIETTWGAEAVNAALALMFTLDGVPMLYNGQEIADTTRHSLYKGVGQTIDWQGQDTLIGAQRWRFVRSLCELRHTHDALADGGVTWLDHSASDAVIAFARHGSGERLLVVVNMRAHTAQVVLPVSGNELAPLVCRGAILTGKIVDLQPYGLFVCKA